MFYVRQMEKKTQFLAKVVIFNVKIETMWCSLLQITLRHVGDKGYAANILPLSKGTNEEVKEKEKRNRIKGKKKKKEENWESGWEYKDKDIIFISLTFFYFIVERVELLSFAYLKRKEIM